MLLLAEPVHHPAIETLYLPVDDGVPLDGGLFQRGLGFIRSHYQQRTSLIACGAGVSRSSTFAIAAIKELERRTLRDAYDVVKRQHPDAVPHPALWRSLCGFYHEEVPFLALLEHGSGEPAG
jgi:protein-tyrosine phosphatase